jgi:hypothetical protein
MRGVKQFSSQRGRVLALLSRNSFVPTYLLARVSPQYNARIYELRRGRHDGNHYNIKPICTHDDGSVLPGFCMMGVKYGRAK